MQEDSFKRTGFLGIYKIYGYIRVTEARDGF